MTELISTEANIARMRPFSMPAGETPAARPRENGRKPPWLNFPVNAIGGIGLQDTKNGGQTEARARGGRLETPVDFAYRKGDG
ncbi:MAG: hypothetical protein PHF93_06605 [Acidobacteriota bacterium]|nr:hypothetical protein [Acidobacteriota bacterium]MDW3226818.1 hypothetical protein [Acidobacteriota bacterium]HOY98416.1 hypothetical protein [Candidatus Aminicenantes bacterium]HPH44662.1 hypothetical protein [Candidatus Aminicenantes bacterium]HPN16192.1 hypothetical protein [Candidatus Aminicenantes bacterium]